MIPQSQSYSAIPTGANCPSPISPLWDAALLASSWVVRVTLGERLAVVLMWQRARIFNAYPALRKGEPSAASFEAIPSFW